MVTLSPARARELAERMERAGYADPSVCLSPGPGMDQTFTCSALWAGVAHEFAIVIASHMEQDVFDNYVAMAAEVCSRPPVPADG